MRSVPFELQWADQFSNQLVTLSELAESLTYRVLELEERLAQQNLQLASLQLASDEHSSGVGKAVEQRLEETEDRLARIERLLQREGKENSPPRSLRSVQKRTSHLPHPPKSSEDEAPEDVVFLEDIFQEPMEEEEPFDHSLAS